MESSCAPVIALSPDFMIPRSLAMAEAVTTWSPVIITGLIPALQQSSTAAFASGRGGSIIPTNPINVKPHSNSSEVGCWGTVSISLYAIARTRRASVLIFSTISFAASRLPDVQRGAIISKAPLTITTFFPFI